MSDPPASLPDPPHFRPPGRRAVALIVAAAALVVVVALVLGLRAWWTHTSDRLADTLDRLPLPPHASLVGDEIVHPGDGPARVSRYYRLPAHAGPTLAQVAAYARQVHAAGYTGVDENGAADPRNLTARSLPPISRRDVRAVAPLRFEPTGCAAGGGYQVTWLTADAVVVTADDRVLACR